MSALLMLAHPELGGFAAVPVSSTSMARLHRFCHVDAHLAAMQMTAWTGSSTWTAELIRNDAPAQ